MIKVKKSWIADFIFSCFFAFIIKVLKEDNVPDQSSPITDEGFSNETISVDTAPVVTFEATTEGTYNESVFLS